MSEVGFVDGLSAPGALGQVVELHGSLDAASHGFGAAFEAGVARGLGAFAARFDPARDLFRAALLDGRVEGSVAVDGEAWPAAARLRWFVLAPALRGRGVGRRLLDEALAHCGCRGFRLAWPETLADLDAAGALYARAGVRVAEERDGARWGSRARERRLVLDLGPGPG